jgi:hypothetical protein
VAACAGAGEYVRILRRRATATAPSELATVSTAAGGTFDLPVIVDATAQYWAVAPARLGCGEATSPAAALLVRGRILVVTGTPARGVATVRGRLTPAAGGSLLLERRDGRAWRPVRTRRVSRSARFAFSLAPRWRGVRRFRVRWRPPNLDHAGAVSRTLSIRGR